MSMKTLTLDDHLRFALRTLPRDMDGRLRLADVAEAVGYSTQTVRKHLLRLLDADEYERTFRRGRPRKPPTPVVPRPTKPAGPPPIPRRHLFAPQAKRIADVYIAGLLARDEPPLTLETMGRAHGVTRQRISQLVKRGDPVKLAMARRVLEARRRQREAVEELERLENRPTCKVCGEPCPPASTIYCGPTHRDMYLLRFRYQCDDEFRSRQIAATARWTLAHPEEREPFQLRHARRVLDGETLAPGETHGRWLVRGSQTMRDAVEAYRRGWPLFGMLHPDVQAQVRRVAEYEDRQRARAAAEGEDGADD